MYVACKNGKIENEYIVRIVFPPKVSFVGETICKYKP
jgi:hypothetical protein